MSEISLPSEHQLFSLTKDQLVELFIKQRKELLEYKRKMLSKKQLIDRYGGQEEISESSINKWMQKGLLPYRKLGKGTRAKVFFPLDKLVEYEDKGIINYKPHE